MAPTLEPIAFGSTHSCAPSPALRAVPLPRFAGEDKRPATVNVSDPTLVTRRARLRARWDLHEQAAEAHRADVLVVDRHARQYALQDPIEAVLLGRPRAAWRADDRRS